MFSGFTSQIIEANSVKINLVKGGKGAPLLLLHGYPQTHFMWHKIAPHLAERFTVIATDLRGYGDSSKPPNMANHYNYSKRVMAEDQIEVMSQLGYQEFYLIGHDRGARVAYRLALDYPEKVKKLALLDIIPTDILYGSLDQELATIYYHWFFLIQPYPFPEELIGSNPAYFLETCLTRWSSDFSAFSPEAVSEYIRTFKNKETQRATCEDYRAAATIDLEHDQLDQGKLIECPTLVLWGKKGIIGRKYDVLALWKERSKEIIGYPLNCGHFLPEEAPLEVIAALKNFI